MFNSISYRLVFGIPFFALFGIAAFISFILAVVVIKLNQKGIHRISFIWHQRLATIGLILVTIHASLAILSYL